MQNETRTLQLDPHLHIEAYRFKGIMQKFPNHFHDYYVIGFIEKGLRYLACQDQEYIINPGDLLLFNPVTRIAVNRLTAGRLIIGVSMSCRISWRRR